MAQHINPAKVRAFHAELQLMLATEHYARSAASQLSAAFLDSINCLLAASMLEQEAQAEDEIGDKHLRAYQELKS